MRKKLLKGRAISSGLIEGEAIVSHDPIVFNLGIDAESGVIVEKGHDLEGKSTQGKILVFPYGKGSTGGAWTIYRMGIRKSGPDAMVCQNSEVLTTVGSIMGDIPVVDGFTPEQLSSIKTGDLLRVDGNHGTVEIL
jgi:phosphomecalonate degydratase small subunit